MGRAVACWESLDILSSVVQNDLQGLRTLKIDLEEHQPRIQKRNSAAKVHQEKHCWQLVVLVEVTFCSCLSELCQNRQLPGEAGALNMDQQPVLVRVRLWKPSFEFFFWKAAPATGSHQHLREASGCP